MKDKTEKQEILEKKENQKKYNKKKYDFSIDDILLKLLESRK